MVASRTLAGKFHQSLGEQLAAKTHVFGCEPTGQNSAHACKKFVPTEFAIGIRMALFKRNEVRWHSEETIA
jgi:hypothetical protein